MLAARVLQHEVDHLDGVLIIDRTRRRITGGRRSGSFGREPGLDGLR